MSRSRALLLLPLFASAGCPLTSFDKVGAPSDASGGSGGSGGAEDDAGAVAGEAGGGGEAPVVDGGVVHAVDDEYVLLQGETIQRASGGGVLQNDQGAGVFVSASSGNNPGLPPAFEATFEILPSGELTFTPVPAFFGVYSVSYTIRDAEGREAGATVRFVVQPRDIELATLAQGVGGIVIDGAVIEGIGTALAGGGDVNGDGRDDLVIGAPGAAAGDGRVYVVYGSAARDTIEVGPAPAASEPRYFALDGSNGETAGVSVSGAGDLDADGFADLVIGANYGGTGQAPGTAYVVYGGALRGAVTLDGMPLTRGYAVGGSGVDVFTNLGRVVAGGGDANGDGTPDLLIATAGAANAGRLNVLFGDPGASLAPGASIDLAAHGAKVFTDGYLNNDGLPQALAYAGDVNDDGLDDIVVSSRNRVALIWGRDDMTFPANVDEVGAGWGLELARPSISGISAVSGAGHVNDDALDDVVVCNRTSAGGPIECFVGFGEPANLTSGWRFTNFAGFPKLPPRCRDLTGDGLSDLLFAETAVAYVVFGKASGHNALAVDALGDNGFVVRAEAGGAITVVADAGDFNGDGRGDYAFADPGARGGRGRVYVLFGGDYVPR